MYFVFFVIKRNVLDLVNEIDISLDLVAIRPRNIKSLNLIAFHLEMIDM